jgi:hypothetical protein
VDRSEFVDATWLVRGRSIVFAFRHAEYRDARWFEPLSAGTRADYIVDRLLIGVYDTRSKRTVVLLRKENPEPGRGSFGVSLEAAGDRVLVHESGVGSGRPLQSSFYWLSVSTGRVEPFPLLEELAPRNLRPYRGPMLLDPDGTIAFSSMPIDESKAEPHRDGSGSTTYEELWARTAGGEFVHLGRAGYLRECVDGGLYFEQGPSRGLEAFDIATKRVRLLSRMEDHEIGDRLSAPTVEWVTLEALPGDPSYLKRAILIVTKIGGAKAETRAEIDLAKLRRTRPHAGGVATGPAAGGPPSPPDAVVPGRHEGGATALAWSPDGRWLASGGADGRIRLWNAETGAVEADAVLAPAPVASVAWRPDGKVLVWSSYEGFPKFWDRETGPLDVTREPHRIHKVRDLAWTPDGATLAASTHDGSVLLLDDAAERYLRHAAPWDRGRVMHGVYALAVSPDGKVVAAGLGTMANVPDENVVELRDVATWAVRARLVGHASYVTALAWSPDGRRLASGSLDYGVKLWDAASGRLDATFLGHTDAVNSVSWSPDGLALASGGSDGTVRLWDPATGRLRATLAAGATVRAVAWGPDGRWLAIATRDGSVSLWRGER